MVLEEFGPVGAAALKEAGVHIDLMTLLDVQFLRGYRDAWKAMRDPNVKEEDIPASWRDRVYRVQNAKILELKAKKEREAAIRKRRSGGQRAGVRR